MLFGIKQFVAIAVLQRCVSEIPPIINIASLFSESASQDHIKETALQIDSALREYGVFVAVGHNITEKMIGSSATAIRELFSLEQNAKESVSLKNTKAFGRGFLGFGEESGLSEFFEPKEGFSYGYPGTASKETEIVPLNLLQCENHFPISLSAQSISALNDMYLNKVVVVKAILRALSLFFDLHSNFPSDFLRNLTSEGETISLMRLFHYFNVQSETVQSRLKAMKRVQGNDEHVNSAVIDDKNADVASNHKQIIGSSPHTDWGLLTLILQDNVGGLQFRHKNTWRDVTPCEANRNGIIVNGGDYLSLITNGRYHSPIHRVLSPGSTVLGDDSLGGSDTTGVRSSNGGSNDNGEVIPGIPQETSAAPVQSDRYSMVFFYYPNYNSSLDSNKQYSFGPVHDDVNSSNHCLSSDTSDSNDNDINTCSAGNEGRSVDSTSTDHTAESDNHKDSSSDSSDDSDGSGSGDASGGDGGDESINYNTLTVASDVKHAPTRYNDQAPGEEKLCFGDYIIKKWQDVNRT